MFLKRQNIELKTEREIEKMRIASRAVAEVLQRLYDVIKPGATTKDIDIFSERYIRSLKMLPAFIGVKGVHGNTFPSSTCVSINNEVVHGIPSYSRVLNNGDLVSVDVGVIYEGYYGDAARTYTVGNVSNTVSRLINVTETSLNNGILEILPGRRLGNISSTIQKTAENAGFSVVRDFVGHGIGKHLHEDPQIPNFGEFNTGLRLLPGIVLAIEPMVNVGGHEVCISNDGWTVVTRDGSLSAHFEHTVLVTKNGYEILTKV
ncbi:MAG: type I methionyl aminopeptidase [Endomicrobium sp.]|nr:type I methionyl aminopeptidase [Endomicrobium sp.]